MRSFFLAAAAAFTFAAAAQADDVPVAYVDFETADLMSDVRLAALEGRIAEAAEGVCRANGVRGIQRLRRERACMAEAMDRAMGELRVRVAEVRGDERLRLAVVGQ